MSGYLPQALERSMWIEARLTHKLTKSILSAQADSIKSERHKKIRTAFALRGGAGGKIRECAARRHLSISDFVVISLRRTWDASERLHQVEWQRARVRQSDYCKVYRTSTRSF